MYKIDTVAIRQLMLRNCLTIRATADRAGVGEGTLRRILGERVRANSATTGKLANALGVEPDLIISKESDLA